MLKKVFLPTIFIILAWGFWVSPDFKVIAAGVAIFLFGMLALENGFKLFTGGALERILSRFTDRRWKSISFGILSTSIMQSSSLVSVITISFLSAGLIGLYAGIGIIFGANIGTTTGAWLVAGFGLKVNIAAYAMPMLVFGMLLIFQQPRHLKGLGYILAGLGFLFLGIHYMKEGFDAFKETIDLTRFSVSGIAGLMIYAGIGIVATVIMQSSHASLVITITALSSGQISYENALALAIGANVGTTVTAIIGAVSSNEQGRRLAVAHLVFNLVTGLLTILFISQILELVNRLSGVMGISQQDYSLKLAVFHTVFNLLGVVIMLPFMKPMVRWLERLIPTREPEKLKPRYLHDSTIAYADTATEAVYNETVHMWDNTIDIIAHGIRVPRDLILDKNKNLEELIEKFPVKGDFDIDRYYELKVKSLYSAIIAFISKASITWDMEQSGEIFWLRKANQDMVEAIKDIKHLQKNLARYTINNKGVIKEQYNRIRQQIINTLRAVESIRHAEASDIPSLMIDQLKLNTGEEYANQNKLVNEMINRQQITGEMAISLMNDKAYVNDFIGKLIDITETLFIRHNRELSSAEKTVQLDDAELQDIREQHELRKEESADGT